MPTPMSPIERMAHTACRATDPMVYSGEPPVDYWQGELRSLFLAQRDRGRSAASQFGRKSGSMTDFSVKCACLRYRFFSITHEFQLCINLQ